MKRAISILLSVLLLFGSIPLSVFVASAADPSENLAADYSNANGAVTWTESAGAWGDGNVDAMAGVLGGRSWKFGLDGTATDGSSYAYITVKASGLKANTYYEFSYVYSQDFRIQFDSVTAPDGSAATLASGPVDTELNAEISAHQISFIFEAAADGDYTIKLKTGKAWQTPTCGWSYTMLSDLSLIEKTGFVPNLAANYSNANGAVTWTANADAWGGTNIDGSDGVLGGRSWKFGVSQTSSSNIAYITVKASGLKANTYYEFSYVYSQDFKILLDSVTAPDGSAAALVSSTVDTKLSTGTRAHQISFIFEAAADGDYTIKLKTGKAWTNEPCGWSYTMLSDLSLIKKTDFVPDLAANYTHANGAVTWTESAGAWGDHIDGSDGVLGGRSWKFGLDGTATDGSSFAYITVKASGLKADTYYKFSYVYSQDFKILLDSVTAPDSSAAALVASTVDTDVSKAGYPNAHQISFIFKAAMDGDYEIKLQTGKAWQTPTCGWSYTMLSDLSLGKIDNYSGIVTASESKAAVRAASGSVKQGIRVKSTINKGWIEAESITQYGILAIRTARLDGAALTCDTTNAAKGVAYDAVTKPDAVLYEETETDNIYAGVMINIPERFYGQTYTVRSYAISSDGDIFYGESFSVCVFDVVKAILAPENAASADDQATANAIIAQAVAAKATDSSVVTYEEWLAAKA